MRRDIGIVALGLALIAMLSYVLYQFYVYFGTIHNTLVTIGVGIIIFFTTLVVLRYMFLLFFSMLKTIFKSADEEEYKPQRYTQKISVIIPAYNEEKVLRSSIASILDQDYANLEIIVVDDGSKDRTYAIAKEFERYYKGPKQVIALRQENRGKANAINTGILHSSGELIMVVDADSKLRPDAVRLMAQYFLDPEISAVAGSVLISNQNNIITKLQALEYVEGLNMVRNGQALLRLVNIIPGPIGMFRKKDLFEVGLYDDDTFAEDCDVTLKLIAHGKKIDFEPDAVALTEAPEHLLDLIKQRYRWTRGILQAIRKHRGALFGFRRNKAFTITLWYMLFETALWPVVDIWVNLFIVYLSITSGVSILIVFWWMLFTILDMAGAMYCVLVTNERLGLVYYAFLYRIFFIPVVNIAKFLAALEEWLHIKMEWGKLERKGRI